MIIAYYTQDTPYENEARIFAANITDYDIPSRIIGYPNQGSWIRNICLKPIFIHRMMQQYPDVKLFLYLDVDARIRQYPKYFDEFSGDLGVHYHKGELLTGTIFIKNNAKTRKLIVRWIEECYMNTAQVMDQNVLDKVIQRNAEQWDIDVINTPAAYTKIFDLMSGEPIIEHLQASRKYRTQIGQTRMQRQIPNIVGRSRVRRSPNGDYMIIRKDKVAEAYLDEHLVRYTNELRWRAGVIQKSLSDLRHHFEAMECYLVGKGPSLDTLKKSDFDEDLPVICLNEAIHKVKSLGLSNEIFMIQSDVRLKDTCEYENMILSSTCASQYKGTHYVYEAMDYRLPPAPLSVVAAIKIAESLGSTGFLMMCFDACVVGNTDYAKCIGYSARQGGLPSRFLSQRAEIEKHCDPEWVIPKLRQEASSDIPPLL